MQHIKKNLVLIGALMDHKTLDGKGIAQIIPEALRHKNTVS